MLSTISTFCLFFEMCVYFEKVHMALTQEDETKINKIGLGKSDYKMHVSEEKRKSRSNRAKNDLYQIWMIC